MMRLSGKMQEVLQEDALNLLYNDSKHLIVT